MVLGPATLLHTANALTTSVRAPGKTSSFHGRDFNQDDNNGMHSNNPKTTTIQNGYTARTIACDFVSYSTLFNWSLRVSPRESPRVSAGQFWSTRVSAGHLLATLQLNFANARTHEHARTRTHTHTDTHTHARTHVRKHTHTHTHTTHTTKTRRHRTAKHQNAHGSGAVC